jgi:hypothetical protein
MLFQSASTCPHNLAARLRLRHLLSPHSRSSSTSSKFPFPSGRNASPHQIFHLPKGASQEQIKARCEVLSASSPAPPTHIAYFHTNVRPPVRLLLSPSPTLPLCRVSFISTPPTNDETHSIRLRPRQTLPPRLRPRPHHLLGPTQRPLSGNNHRIRDPPRSSPRSPSKRTPVNRRHHTCRAAPAQASEAASREHGPARRVGRRGSRGWGRRCVHWHGGECI